MFNYNLFLKRLSSRKYYDKSFIKNEVAQRLLKRLEFVKLNPLDIFVDGYHDKEYLQILQTRFRNSRISAHINHPKKFDIIISNSTIHLTDNIVDKLDYYYELLNDNGTLLFSTFGDKSFTSLNQASADIGKFEHINNMIDPLTWGATLQSSRYKSPAIESDLITFTYEKVETIFGDIRALNEPLADTKMHIGLTGKNYWHNFIENFRKALQLEIEALYGYAIRKDNKKDIAPRTNFNRISIDELKKQILDFKNSNNT